MSEVEVCKCKSSKMNTFLLFVFYIFISYTAVSHGQLWFVVVSWSFVSVVVISHTEQCKTWKIDSTFSKDVFKKVYMLANETKGSTNTSSLLYKTDSSVVTDVPIIFHNSHNSSLVHSR